MHLRPRLDHAGVRVLMIAAIAVLAAGAAPAEPVVDLRQLEPEAATGRVEKPAVTARRHMVVAANPLAADAGLDVLRAEGSAVDAAIAVQMVLALVEPQSSGLGGGAFLVTFDQAAQTVTTIDGRETAPRAAAPTWFLAADGRPRAFQEIVTSPLSVGVPGVVRALAMAHVRHGRLPWARLFDRAIALAEGGFAVSPRLNALLAAQGASYFDASARALYYDASGAPWPAGTLLKNPALAASLKAIAAGGADAFYSGAIAEAILAALAGPQGPPAMTASDLATYAAKWRDPVCPAYRAYRICSMGAPSSGGIAMGMVLGMAQAYAGPKDAPGRERGPAEAAAVLAERMADIALLAEAEKLAYADRDQYVADPEFAPQAAALLDPAYLAARAKLIDPARPMTRAEPGQPPFKSGAVYGLDATVEQTGTSHVSIVDGAGNAAALTTSVQTAFGSGRMAAGFLLNSQLTDFSFKPADTAGMPVANRIEGGKRPRSSMAPTIIFDPAGKLFAVLGSPGGNRIILYNLKAIVCLIDWACSADLAAGLPGFGSRNGPLEVEQGTAAEAVLGPALAASGATVKAVDMTSGLAIIERHGDAWSGAADPRREGAAVGD